MIATMAPLFLHLGYKTKIFTLKALNYENYLLLIGHDSIN